jgi:hypothetical protein
MSHINTILSSKNKRKSTKTIYNIKTAKNEEIIYPKIEEITKLDFAGYCPYLNDYERKIHQYEGNRKAEFCDQLIYIPTKE